ncbi:hypothetical protein [Gluconobacter morbifer]|uniref:DUF2867 domain-containing protein n=1 Tax=Gluconobacter morbifer G707 TaxID=1088869 RepID=G6XGT0_9PROT|nr:hypothetical protein [Gluconobacter morbifer]EHH69388.1 hypothetical protein GMO_06950 [Gluconobacter morbifer G707]
MAETCPRTGPAFHEHHVIDIAATPATVLEESGRYRIQHDPLARLAIRLREWPARLLRQSTSPPLDLTDFTLLEQDCVRRVYGLQGAFWKAGYGLRRISSRSEFLAYQREDLCTLFLSFTVSPGQDGKTRLATSTTVTCPSWKIWWRFLPYWLLIRPVSGLLRQRMLRQIKARCEIFP